MDDLPALVERLQARDGAALQRAAAALAAARRGYFAAACGRRPAVARAVAAVLGHRFVPEGAPVFRRGAPGDAMYVVLSGYCEVSRQVVGGGGGGAAASRRTTGAAMPQPASGGSAGAADDDAAAHAPSRRVTLERQRTELLRGLAAGGSGRQGSGLDAAAATAAARRAASAVIAAAASGEAPTADGPAEAPESPHPAPQPAAVAWLCEGDSFGEAALLDPARRRGCTVTAGDGGAHLAAIDAAALRRLAAGAPPGAAQVVVAAACRRALAAPPGQRPEEDVEALALLFGELQALARLPESLRLRLARDCAAVSVPAGGVLCRQGERGDAMFVVLRGCCAARAVPPPEGEAAETAAEAAAAHGPAASMQQQQLAAGAPMLAAGPWSSPQPQIQQPGPLRAAGGRRGATWEEAAFTAEERRRLAAVEADLRAGQKRDEATGLLRHAAEAEEAEARCARDSLYWVAKYVRDAASAAATASGPAALGPEGQGLSPLAAVAAARWRDAVRGQQAARLAARRTEDVEDAEAKVLQGMEQLLGRGAARAWAEARKAAKAPPPPPGAARAAEAAAGAAGVRQPEEEGGGPADAGDGAAGDGAEAATEAAAPPAAAPTDAEALAAELAARATLEGVLSDVAAAAARKGLPPRLGRRASLKITRELNRRVLGGASCKGLPGAAAAAAAAPAEPGATAEGGGGGGGGAEPQVVDAARLRRSRGSDASDARTELTGLAGSEWNVSFGGGSDAASLLGSLEFEGSLLLAGGAPFGSRPGSCGLAAEESCAAVAAATAADLEARFGAVTRVVGPGQSFGERALLSRRWARAATVVAADPAAAAAAAAAKADDGSAEAAAAEAGAEAEAESTPPSPSAPPSPPPPVELLRIGRATFDAAVRALQLEALEAMLGLLASAAPLAGLPREQLTALAVFCRPAAAAAGEVVAGQGEPVEALAIVADGELRLLDGPAPLSATAAAAAASAAGEGAARLREEGPEAGAGGAAAAAAAAGGARAERRRATADQLLRAAVRGAGNSTARRALLRNASLPARGTAAGGAGVLGGGVLTVLGPGGLLGENVLGDDSEDAPPGGTDEGPALARRPRPLHAATAVAVRPSRLILLAAADLRRFGRRLRAPLAEAAARRAEFLAARRRLLHGAAAGVEAAAADLRRQLTLGGAPAAGPSPAAAAAAAAASAAPLTPWDVRAGRQIVPPRPLPSLVEVAASGRPFPQALLSATAAPPPAPSPPQRDGGGAAAAAGAWEWAAPASGAAHPGVWASSAGSSSGLWRGLPSGLAGPGSSQLSSADAGWATGGLLPGGGAAAEALGSPPTGAQAALPPAQQQRPTAGPGAAEPEAPPPAAPPRQQQRQASLRGGRRGGGAGAARVTLGGGFVASYGAKRLADESRDHQAVVRRLQEVKGRQA
ncbi:hypothetical protein Rsub_01481 [Raphidocelis subcapitata]|uniref:Cyclic nucleotide-binding domain-containing protein n=1 Tax=Raphidocelis subcapitata TaxID=307507 RepID=A0A2V0NQU0_9CHLO|nr:hypothetical protein Rsub_01481 [Raphidocelis subcapitata]|eukprot:GBF88982.1 hypothetical protein Rsub_01481 [Raphidocelis subcapitata]